jgi:8-oxo-dGTP pyrophosphatase MutT (NUDIX family)
VTPAVAPRHAATLVAVRDSRAAQATQQARGVEVFCVERGDEQGILRGAVVFPGGKLEPDDLDPAWAERVTPPRTPSSPIAADPAMALGLAVAACREALEEAAILPVSGGPLDHAELLAWRGALASRRAHLHDLLAARGLRLDLASLHPFARWITPESESRRFDARFFLFVADDALVGAHDGLETTGSFWAAPGELLRRFAAGELPLLPPTHRTLEILARASDASHAARMASEACLSPVCPRRVVHRDHLGSTVALVLPGDPEHEVTEARSPGKSRYVLRGDRFLPEDAPPPHLPCR